MIANALAGHAPAARYAYVVAAALIAVGAVACDSGAIDGDVAAGFPPDSGTTAGGPCRAPDHPLGQCDQDLGGADFVDLVCLNGTCVVDCAEGGDVLCRTIVAEFLTCSELAGDVCVRACGAPDDTCPEGFSCFDREGSCLPTGSFPTSPCRQGGAPCDPVRDAAMVCTAADVCAIGCAEGGAAACRQVDATLTCSGAAGDVCVVACEAGCPDGFSCLDREGACLPTGAFPGSPCRVDAAGSEPGCDDLAGAVAMACVDATCVVPCQPGDAGAATCQGVDDSLVCSAAAGVCVPGCGVDGACPDGFSCLDREGACLPTGSFPGSPCAAGDACADLDLGDATAAMICALGTCVIPCAPAASGEALCQDVDAALTCSAAAGACVRRCGDDGACADGFSCLDAEGACLPTGAFPGSPCRADLGDGGARCDADLGDNPDLDLRCHSDRCLVDCAAGGDFICDLLDAGLACSEAAGGLCLPACGADGACPEGTSCFASEGTCLPTGSFPGGPCGAGDACGDLGDLAMVCAAPAEGLDPVCLVDCTAGGVAACQAVDASLSCYTGASPALCLPSGAFPESLCRQGDGLACDQDLFGSEDVDLTCVAGTCQLACAHGGDTLCGMIAQGQGLADGALTCVDFGSGAFCARAGCDVPGVACPADYFCDAVANACLPYRPVQLALTADLHSHFDGLPPLACPTAGGFPQLASLIQGVQARAAARGAIGLTLDAGDWMMGSLFQVLQGTVETDFFRYAGYDAVAMGERELDWGPAAFASFLLKDTGPARTLEAALAVALGCAAGVGQCPALDPVPVIASSLAFDPTSSVDDALAALYDKDDSLATGAAPLNRYVVLDRGGVKVGVLSLIGTAAARSMPAAEPLTFAPATEAAREMVALLRSPDVGADLVVALSHAGAALPPYRFEDEAIAEAVAGIDLIVSGHTGALVPPARFGDTWLVQPGHHGGHLAELELAWPTVPEAAGYGALDPQIVRWTAHPVDPDGAADPVLAAARDSYLTAIDNAFSDTGLTYDSPLGHIATDLLEGHLEASRLGALVADAARARVDTRVASSDDATPIDVGLVAGAELRDDLRLADGLLPTPITFADAFAVVPLGASPTDHSAPGFPMVTFYLTADELKQVFEVSGTLGPANSDDYWISPSGLRWVWDPDAAPFARVRGLWLDPSGLADVCSEADNLLTASGLAKDPSALYRVSTGLYLGGLLSKLGVLTGGLVEVTPKGASGSPVDVLDHVVSDAAGQVRQWQTLVEHLGDLAGGNGGLISEPAGPRVLTTAERGALCD